MPTTLSVNILAIHHVWLETLADERKSTVEEAFGYAVHKGLDALDAAGRGGIRLIDSSGNVVRPDDPAPAAHQRRALPDEVTIATTTIDDADRYRLLDRSNSEGISYVDVVTHAVAATRELHGYWQRGYKTYAVNQQSHGIGEITP